MPDAADVTSDGNHDGIRIREVRMIEGKASQSNVTRCAADLPLVARRVRITLFALVRSLLSARSFVRSSTRVPNDVHLDESGATFALPCAWRTAARAACIRDKWPRDARMRPRGDGRDVRAR